MKYIYLYKTTRKFDDSYYIGVHTTDTLYDGYLGTGKRIKASIKKHGREAHSFEILEFFDNVDEAFRKEAEMVTADIVLDPLCLNLQPGGIGGRGRIPSEEHRRKLSKALKGRECSPEHRAKNSASHRGKRNPPEAYEKMAATNRGRKRDKSVGQNIARSLCKSCTIDGITIYPSRKALVEALGRNKDGARNPNFRYVEIQSTVAE